MKTHTTNYYDTFIVISDDCPVVNGEVPPVKGDARTAANIQFDLIVQNPYKYTSDDVLFQVFADKNDLTEAEYEEARKQFFLKGASLLKSITFNQKIWLGRA